MNASKVMIFGKHQDDDWQQLLDGQGLFMFAEAAINEAVPSLAEKWGGSLEQTRLYWGRRESCIALSPPISSLFIDKIGQSFSALSPINPDGA
ncbi:hypothetical protein ACSZOM_17275 [Aeromonas hydrophila]